MPLFTSETAKAARAQSGSTKKAALKLQKYLAKLGIEKDYIEAFMKGLSSPVVAGVAMYLLLMGLERLTDAAYTQKSPVQNPQFQNQVNVLTQLIGFVSNALPFGQLFGFTNTMAQATLSANPFKTDFTVLKAAVAIYITTGGNIAGLLGTATNLFSGLTKSA